MKLVLATQNTYKVQEIKEIFGKTKFQIVPLSELYKNFVIIEDGLSLEYNAKKKAEQVMQKTKLISIGEDTGLEVDVLNGQPGIYSARFAGEKATYAQNVQKLLNLLKGIKDTKRTARFKCICALSFPEQYQIETQLFEGICSGRIIKELRGNSGFGYDPIFVPNGYNQTFAELSSEIKNQISHRAQAIKKVKSYLGHMHVNE